MRSEGRFLLMCLAVGLSTCRVAVQQPHAPPADPDVVEAPAVIDLGDLDAVRARGILRALVLDTGEEALPRPTRRSATIHRDRAREIARRLGVKVQYVPVDSIDGLERALLAGRGDVIADDLIATAPRAERIAFTRPVTTTSELLVGRRGDNNPRALEELAGHAVHVPERSPYAETLARLRAKVDVTLVEVPGNVDPESLVWEVSRGTRPLTIVDANLFATIESYNSDVERLFEVAPGRDISWGVRLGNPELKAALDAFLVEKALLAHSVERATGDLDEIRKRGTLRVLTRNNGVTYYLHRGRHAGFDYELARMYAASVGVRLEMIVVPSFDQLVPWLLEGRGDVIAASFTVTPERAADVAFTRPYMYVDELLVRRPFGPPSSTLDDLRGRTIHVRASSSYRRTLERLRHQYGFSIAEVPEDVETEELIDRVGRGEIDFTVADAHMLAVETAWRDDVEAAFALPTESRASAEGAQAIAFAVRPHNLELFASIDVFVRRTYRGLEYNVLRERYFEGDRVARRAQTRHALDGAISQYDELIRRHAARYELDWRLLAAQAYQESRFNPRAVSFAGAIGLFQVMPETGKMLGFTNLFDPDQGAQAGIAYLHTIIDRLDPRIPFKQRLRFALAGYNVGIGHVSDARRLAEELGYDRDRWFGNVEHAMLLLQQPKYYRHARHGYCRGAEPVRYVSEIQSRYDDYVRLVPQGP